MITDDRTTPIRRLSDVYKDYEADSIRRRRVYEPKQRAYSVLFEAQQYWNNMDRFRRDRERARRYTYGDQWGDRVCVDGVEMTEEEHIRRQGSVPLKNNLIRRLVNSVLGAYRNQGKDIVCVARDRDEQTMGETMSIVLQYVRQANEGREIEARTFEDFLIGGLAVYRKWYGWRDDRMECWTDYVNPNNFFVDSNMRDFRGWDCSCVGEIHDIPFTDLVERFAHNGTDYKRLTDIYRSARDRAYLMHAWAEFGYAWRETYTDFLCPFDQTRCRVIEVWRRETRPRYRCHDINSGEVFKIEVGDVDAMVTAENTRRLQQAVAEGISPDEVPLIRAEWFIDSYWYYYFLSPFGDILEEGETPYEHGSHPYVFRAFPFIDGEIHSFVSDIIDQQRYVNRLITLYDWIMRASAKGVLLFPEEALPKDMSIEDVADEWARFNGVIMIRTRNGATMPQQIANKSTNIGIQELLQLQLQFFEDISGVHGALQGKPGYSGMSAALYSQQAQNATTTLADMLESFGAFLVDGARKDVHNIQQFYEDRRYIVIAGRRKGVQYDPETMGGVDFDLSITESVSTAAYRNIANDFLLEIWRSGQITLRQLLEAGSFPFSDILLQSIGAQEEQLAAGQQPSAVDEGVMTQARQGADMDAVARAQQMLQR